MAMRTPDKILQPGEPGFPKTLVFIDGRKGGIGKSASAGAAAATYEDLGYRVLVVDTDTSNATTYSTRDDAKFVDIRETRSRGAILGIVRQLEKEFDHAVLDIGARSEEFLEEHTPWLVRELEKVKARLIVLRPLTSEPVTQSTAIEFADMALPAGAAVIFIRNFGQGRKPADFLDWSKSESRARALAAGAVEVDLQDLGTALDTARGFGLSVADVALGRFDRAGEDAQLAEQQLDADTQLWFSIWLSENCAAMATAIARAVAQIKRRTP